MNTLIRASALAVAASGVLLLQGCFPTSSASVYNRGQAQREQIVRMGVVESVREVVIRDDQGASSNVGGLAGAAVGAIAGSNVGGGKGSTIGAIAGGLGGLVAGSALGRKLEESKGQEITVKMDSGELRAITQEADEAFKPGERVRLVSGGGVTRVT
ncbi:MAG: hypothetical protein MO847_10595, partial [Candidatus Protistobacter heckmanni]|nr:hypothetical protein [Candidatus Protistobacter heckmanni]